MLASTRNQAKAAFVEQSCRIHGQDCVYRASSMLVRRLDCRHTTSILFQHRIDSAGLGSVLIDVEEKAVHRSSDIAEEMIDRIQAHSTSP